MVQFYVCRIKLGRMTIEDVPEKRRDTVKTGLETV